MARRRSVAVRIVVSGVLVAATVVGMTAAPAVAGTAAKKRAKKPTIVISGDFKVKAVTTLRCQQLRRLTPTTGSRSLALTAPPAKKPVPGDGSYGLDLNNMTLGGTTTLPAAPTGNSSTMPSVRFSYNTNGDYLDWGGPSVTGTVKFAADGGSGSVDLQVPFFGDDQRTVPATAHQSVTVKGKFKCPPGP
jgi:hypothetical protein